MSKAKKTISFMLILTLVLTLFPLASIPAAAQGGPAGSGSVSSESSGDGESYIPQIHVKTLEDYEAEQSIRGADNGKPETGSGEPDLTNSGVSPGFGLFNADTPVMDTANQRFYANGTPIVIKNNGSIESIYDSTGTILLSGSENMYYYEIFGGWKSGTHIGDTSIIIEDPLLNCNIYGGSCDGILIGDTSVVVNGGTVFTVFGGNGQGQLQGSTSVVINDGSISGIYGGSRGDYYDEEIGAVTGDTYVEINDGSFFYVGDICGGGYYAAVKGDTEVVINSQASILLNMIFGGGYDGPVEGSTSVVVDGAYVQALIIGGGCWGNVTGNTAVTVKNDAYIYSGIYGGGWGDTGRGTVGGDATVTVEDSTVMYAVHGGGYDGVVSGGTFLNLSGSYFGNWVVGGGLNGSVSGATNVVITDCEVDELKGRIIGGGENGSVHSTNVTVNPGANETDGTYGVLCGGGQRGQAVFGTNVEINGGTFSDVVCAGGAGSAATTDDTSLTINGGSFAWVYGGGWDANVYGNTDVSVTGGNFSALYGGGCWWSKVNGNTNVTVNGGNFGYVYGGGQGPSSGGYTGEGAVTGNTSVTVNDGTVYNLLCGGGSNATATVGGTAHVAAKEGTFGAIYGGGWDGNVTGAAVVDIWPEAVRSSVTHGGANGGTVGAGSKINYWYHVTYDLNGGSGTAPTQGDVIEGNTFTAAEGTGLTNPTAPYPGKHFKEWSENVAGAGTKYGPGVMVTMPSSNLTLFAIWEDNTPVTGITVSGQGGADTITHNGGTLQMLADITPTSATNQEVEWSVASGPGLASINGSGLLTALGNGNGQVTVRATAKDGSTVFAEKTIDISGQTIPIVLVTDITVSGEGGETSIITIGGTLQMYATVNPSGATDSTYTWSVEKGTGEATISSSGLITAVAGGTVTVKATANDTSGVVGGLAITIGDQNIYVTSITVTGQDSRTAINTTGGTLQLLADVQPPNTTNSNFIWSVENNTPPGSPRATIDQNGLLTALRNGTVTVKATANDGSGKYGQLSVTIAGQYNQHDVDQIAAFFNQSDGSVTNADKLRIDAGDISTWTNVVWWENLDGIHNVSHLNLAYTATNLQRASTTLPLHGTLDLSGCNGLIYMDIGENNLTGINIANCPSLTGIRATSNSLSYLNLSGCNALTSVYCSNNNLQSLDASGCPNLILLDCASNPLSSLNVSNSAKLKYLWCSDTSLTNIDASGCTDLLEIEAHGNTLNNLSQLKALGLELLTYTENGIGYSASSNTLADGTPGTLAVTSSNGGFAKGEIVGALVDGRYDIILVVYPDSGYRFVRWENAAGLSNIVLQKDSNDIFEALSTSNTMSIRAVFELVKSGSSGGGGGGTTTYAITFETNGGSAVSRQTIASGGTVAKPIDPMREGYTFTGWYTDSTCTTRYDFSSKVTKSFTLYAGWEKTEKSIDGNLFDDISGHWAEKYINSLGAQGYVNGTGNRMFSPNAPLTRAQFVQILYNAFGNEDTSSPDAPFSDTDQDAWYAKALNWAYANELIQGYTEDTFGPSDEITREQMAVLIVRAAEKFSVTFPSVNAEITFDDNNLIGSYAKDAVCVMQAAGIISGKPGNIFDPKGSATRGEMAKVMYFVLDYAGMIADEYIVD